MHLILQKIFCQSQFPNGIYDRTCPEVSVKIKVTSVEKNQYMLS